MKGRQQTVMRSRVVRQRAGVAVVIVLGLLAVTLALSYAMLRSQTTIETMQRNDGFRSTARQAAQAGLTAGLRAMHGARWAGVDTPLSGKFDDNTSYTVTYQTGDASLKTTDADYDEYPYRVTVTSKATATDPATPAVQSTYTSQAVVQLIRRKLADQPSAWTAMQPYTVYQWGTGSGREVDIEVPVRVEGLTLFQNEVAYLQDYPNDGDDKAFHGSIDEVLILKSALSQAQLQAIATGALTLRTLVATAGVNAQDWWRLDDSTSSAAVDTLRAHHGRYDGAGVGASPAPIVGGTGAASFDGFNDHVDLGPVDISGDQMTILAWFKVDSFNHSDGRIISKATGSSTSEHYWMVSTYKSSGHNRLRFRLRTGGSTSNLIASSGDIAAGTWIFAAAVYDGRQMRLYQDGTLVGSMSKSGSISTNSRVRASLGNNPPGSPRARLLRDLEAMRVAGAGDFRPLANTVTAPLSLTGTHEQSLLTDETNIKLSNTTQGSGAAPVAHPGDVTSYQLYPGGKSYAPTILGSSIRNATFTPDPKTNPLGLLKRTGTVQVYSNVAIQGTILTYDSGSSDIVQLRGTRIKMIPTTLPSIYGDSTVRQLPTILSGDDIEVYGGSDSTVTGLVMAWDDLECLQGSQSTTLNIEGQVAAREFEIQARNEWDQSSSWWKTRLHDFLTQLDGRSPVLHFPVWLKQEHGLDYEPKITIQPASATVTNHWHDWSQPLFVAHPDDGGLRWDVIRWVDNP